MKRMIYDLNYVDSILEPFPVLNFEEDVFGSPLR